MTVRQGVQGGSVQGGYLPTVYREGIYRCIPPIYTREAYTGCILLLPKEPGGLSAVLILLSKEPGGLSAVLFPLPKEPGGLSFTVSLLGEKGAERPLFHPFHCWVRKGGQNGTFINF